MSQTRAAEDKVTQAGYSRAQFEAAYRSLVQMCHALSYIHVPEIIRWITKITEEDSAAQGVQLTPAQLEGRERTIALFRNMETFKATMTETGIPPQPQMRVKKPTDGPPPPTRQ